jgi:hypothetical protein
MDVGTYYTTSIIRVNIQITETAESSEMSAYLNRNTRHHISEWGNLYSNGRNYLTTNLFITVFKLRKLRLVKSKREA